MKTALINENRVCCRKGLPAAGSVFECGLVPQGAAEMLLRDALGFWFTPQNKILTPANLTGKTNLALSNFDWYWEFSTLQFNLGSTAYLVNYLNV